MIETLSISAISNVMDRLKGQVQQDGSGLGKGKQSGAGRFDELLSDPLLKGGKAGLIDDFLGIGGNDSSQEDLSAVDSAILGSMDLMNTKALATLTRIMGDEGNTMASMFRSITRGDDFSSAMQAQGIQAYQAAAGQLGATESMAEIAEAIGQPESGNALTGLTEASFGRQAYQRVGLRSEMEKANQNVTVAEASHFMNGNDMPTAGARSASKAYQTAQATAHIEQAEATPGAATEPTKQVENTVASQPSSSSPALHTSQSHRGEYIPGELSRKFESGNEGSAAIGYDRVGGTSYGKYQFSSRAGTMEGFINFLDDHNPQFAQALRKAGPADTGSRFGEMPTAWKKLASDHPTAFGNAQDAFIAQSNFKPALRTVTKAMNVGDLNPALQEVLFSTSVQHGAKGAVSIFAKAFGKLGGFSEGQEADFIKNIYAIRARQFGSSSNDIQQSVKSRLGKELRSALSMLEDSGLV